MTVSLDAFQVIKSPIITEKVSVDTEQSNIWGFKVDRRANKIQIRQAVEQIWEVKVLSVNTMIRKGKPRRVGRGARARLWTARHLGGTGRPPRHPGGRLHDALEARQVGYRRNLTRRERPRPSASKSHAATPRCSG